MIQNLRNQEANNLDFISVLAILSHTWSTIINYKSSWRINNHILLDQQNSWAFQHLFIKIAASQSTERTSFSFLFTIDFSRLTVFNRDYSVSQLYSWTPMTREPCTCPHYLGPLQKSFYWIVLQHYAIGFHREIKLTTAHLSSHEGKQPYGEKS